MKSDSYKDLPAKKSIALVAHDHRKQDLLEWCEKHRDELVKHNLFATGTTGSVLERKLDLPFTKYMSGPLGGDFQIGSAIVDGKIDMLIFFWDPLESLGHDPDVKALLRLATLYNIPMACNQASADFFLNSTLMSSKYERQLNLIEQYQTKRKNTSLFD